MSSLKADIMLAVQQDLMHGENRVAWWHMIHQLEMAINMLGPDSDTL